jgi:hypothetical protein
MKRASREPISINCAIGSNLEFPALNLYGAAGCPWTAEGFFGSDSRDPNARRVYLGAARRFSGFCAEIEPGHVPAFVEAQLKQHSRLAVRVGWFRSVYRNGGRKWLRRLR